MVQPVNNKAPLSGLSKLMAMKGRKGDTMLAHINPAEARLLKALGGAGTLNPTTGLPEFWAGEGGPGDRGSGASESDRAGGGENSNGGNNGDKPEGGVNVGEATQGQHPDQVGGSYHSGYTGGTTSGSPTEGDTGFGGSVAGEKDVTAKDIQEAYDKAQHKAEQKALDRSTIDLGDLFEAVIPGLNIERDVDVTETETFSTDMTGASVDPLGLAAGLAGYVTGLPLGTLYDMYEGGWPGGTEGPGPGLGSKKGEKDRTDSQADKDGKDNDGDGLVDEENEGKDPTDPSIRQLQSGLTQEDFLRVAYGQKGPYDFFNPYKPESALFKAKGGSLNSLQDVYELGGGNYAEFSGLVKGEGDGMSDEVPFKVNGGPDDPDIAMLSTDEYVIDANTMSLLGNGSPTAGAKVMDQFRKDLREKATGNPKQPKQLDGLAELVKMTSKKKGKK